MKLSRLRVDPIDPLNARALADCYRLHQALMRAFEGGRDRNQVLFRVESSGRRPLTILVQSLTEPDWDAVDWLRLWGPPECRELQLDFELGRRYRFRLRANPTRRLPAGGAVRADGRPADGPRVDLRLEWQQLEWLDKRAAACGFELPERHTWTVDRRRDGQLEPLDLPAVQADDLGPCWGRKNGHPVTVRTVEYNGYLRVTDPHALAAAVTAGIGPAKALGCGLLSLARA